MSFVGPIRECGFCVVYKMGVALMGGGGGREGRSF